MGLRSKLIIALLLVFGALGLVIITTIQSRVTSSYDKIEFDAAQADLIRLVEALADSVQRIDDALLEWAVWTELYNFMESGDAKFRASYISPEGITQARYSWLGIYDVQGRIFGSVGHDLDRRAALVLPALEDPANPLARALGAPLAPGAVHCGLIKVEAQLYAMCRRAILDSRGAGPAHGVIVILKAIGPEFMARIIRQTKLDAQIIKPQINKDEACGLCTPIVHSSIGSGRAHAVRSPETYVFHWQLQDVLGQDIDTLAMTSPRSISQQGRHSINEFATLFIIILGAGALLMLQVINRLVVHRVSTLARALHDICAQKNWALRTADSQKDEIGELSAGTNDLLGLIQLQMSELEEKSSTDPLTGLANRRLFDEYFPKLIRQHQRNVQPLSLVVIDVDCFKDYNDNYGHVQGDEALRVVAECLRESALRAVDLPLRIGGEEFLIVLPDCTVEGACAVAERFCEILRGRRIEHAFSQAGPYLSASLGVCGIHPDDTPESFITRADMAMYRAKALGRDRVEIYPDAVPPAGGSVA